jgi:hypothetical protein
VSIKCPRFPASVREGRSTESSGCSRTNGCRPSAWSAGCAYSKAKLGHIGDAGRQGTESLRCVRSSASAESQERIFIYRKMGPDFVVIRGVVLKNVAQVRLTEHHDVVEFLMDVQMPIFDGYSAPRERASLTALRSRSSISSEVVVETDFENASEIVRNKSRRRIGLPPEYRMPSSFSRRSRPPGL